MPTWLKTILIWTLGPVIVALTGGWFMKGWLTNRGLKNGKLTVGPDRKVTKVVAQATPANPQPQAQGQGQAHAA